MKQPMEIYNLCMLKGIRFLWSKTEFTSSKKAALKGGDKVTGNSTNLVFLKHLGQLFSTF